MADLADATRLLTPLAPLDRPAIERGNLAEPDRPMRQDATDTYTRRNPPPD